MSKQSLFRLSSKVFNTPHLITPSAFNVILDYLDLRNAGLDTTITEREGPSEDDSSGIDEENKLAVINIDGSLTYLPLMTLCGEVGTSYQSLSNLVEEAIEAGCETIIFNVTSGGGEASHVFQCAADIRSMCDKSGVKLIAYADTYACSAAYALSVIADEIIANPSATVGSIGCVVCLMDTSKAMEKAGLKRIFITSGDSKVPYAEDGTFKDDFLAEVQKDVNELNDEFASFVSEYTGIDSKLIRGFNAKTFNANEALENGLVNKIMTNKEFTAYVVSLHQGVNNAGQI